ncbi:hypothetical protein ACOJVU_06500 [Mycobacterium sp. THU-M104]|uniref:hypothetical protein n=1 Tax=Mycobacterium sp. THU-M104 TaxID=3410515 RepID=UPI003B9C140E
MTTRRILARDEIVALLTEFGQRPHEQHARGELIGGGGAARALAYDACRIASDVDAAFDRTALVNNAIRHIASRHGSADDWINDAVNGFLPGNGSDVRVMLDDPVLRVSIPSTEYALELKVHAAQPDLGIH